MLTALADKHGVSIEGEAQALGDDPNTMDQERLVQWYKSMGFIVTHGHGDYPEIEYTPSSRGDVAKAKIPPLRIVRLKGFKRPH